MQSEPTRTGTLPATRIERTPLSRICHTPEGYRARGPSEQEAMRRVFARLEREAKEEYAARPDP